MEPRFRGEVSVWGNSHSTTPVWSDKHGFGNSISLYYTVKATSVQKRSLVSFLVRQSQKIRYQEYLHILTLRPRVSRFILITMPVMIHPKDTNIQRVVGFCRSKICHVLRLRFSIFEVFSDDKNNFFI